MTDGAAATAAAVDIDSCRLCGRPRGETVGSGTRCPRCAARQFVQLWIAISLITAFVAATNVNVEAGVVAGLAAFVGLPFVLTAVVVIHELTHALAGLALGFVVTKVEIGEGPRLAAVGRDPQLVIGAIPGVGWTHVVNLRRAGYRARWIVFGLSAPVVSALVAALQFLVAQGWSEPARTVGIEFGLLSVGMAVITLLPSPSFHGRLWSDLAIARSVARMTDADVGLDLVGMAGLRVRAQLDRGDGPGAVATAEAAVAAAPEVPSSRSLLCFALHAADRPDDAAAVAREALARPDLDEPNQAYLAQFVADSGPA